MAFDIVAMYMSDLAQVAPASYSEHRVNVWCRKPLSFSIALAKMYSEVMLGASLSPLMLDEYIHYPEESITEPDLISSHESCEGSNMKVSNIIRSMLANIGDCSKIKDEITVSLEESLLLLLNAPVRDQRLCRALMAVSKAKLDKTMTIPLNDSPECGMTTINPAVLAILDTENYKCERGSFLPDLDEMRNIVIDALTPIDTPIKMETTGLNLPSFDAEASEILLGYSNAFVAYVTALYDYCMLRYRMIFIFVSVTMMRKQKSLDYACEFAYRTIHMAKFDDLVEMNLGKFYSTYIVGRLPPSLRNIAAPLRSRYVSLSYRVDQRLMRREERCKHFDGNCVKFSVVSNAIGICESGIREFFEELCTYVSEEVEFHSNLTAGSSGSPDIEVQPQLDVFALPKYYADTVSHQICQPAGCDVIVKSEELFEVPYELIQCDEKEFDACGKYSYGYLPDPSPEYTIATKTPNVCRETEIFVVANAKRVITSFEMMLTAIQTICACELSSLPKLVSAEALKNDTTVISPQLVITLLQFLCKPVDSLIDYWRLIGGGDASNEILDHFFQDNHSRMLIRLSSFISPWYGCVMKYMLGSPLHDVDLGILGKYVSFSLGSDEDDYLFDRCYQECGRSEIGHFSILDRFIHLKVNPICDGNAGEYE